MMHISTISTLTRQSLCSLLDPEDQLGRDWCLLAVRMGLIDKVPKLEGARRGQSQTAKLLDEWEKHQSSTIGKLFRHTVRNFHNTL
jgi:death-associated protein kinase